MKVIIRDTKKEGSIWAAHAETLASWCIHRIGVAALNHKVADDAVEECAVVVALAH